MAILALLFLLLLGLFSTGSFSPYPDPDTSGVMAQGCAVEDGVERCTPTTIDGWYQLPASGTVIHVIVNNGSLPPEYQQGYEITIDVTGLATVVVTPEGAAEELGDQRTVEHITTTVSLGTEGLQQLLHDLESASFFFLPTREEVEADGVIAGDTVSVVEVTLDDGSWEISGSGMDAGDRARLDDIQSVLAAAVGLDPANPTGTSM